MADLNRNVKYKDSFLQQALNGERFLLFDGGMGTMLQQEGLSEIANPPDLLNLEMPDAIEEIHRAYVEAGCDVVTTNTFNANPSKLDGKAEIAHIYNAATKIARAAGARYVAGEIGPTGTLLEPMGTTSFEDAYNQFSICAKAAESAGCDLIIIETMSDLKEAKAAVLASLENTSLPVCVTMSFEEDGRTFLGTTPEIAATTLSSLGVQAVGVNCSVGPAEMLDSVKQIRSMAHCAVLAQPNAGLPKVVDGKTVYDVDAVSFAESMKRMVDAGATIIGGCCGTNPTYIKALREMLDSLGKPKAYVPHANSLVVCSAQEIVKLPEGESHIKVIGERINPTGKKLLQAALKDGNVDYVVAEAVAQVEAGADILDINVGLPGIDEPALLSKCVEEIQSCIPVPLQIDSADAEAIERAVRSYPGRPLVNSVNGKQSNLKQILPIVAKYGCSVIGLTLDENGIPQTAEERLAIARRIVKAAEEYGIPRGGVVIDCLAMSVSTNQDEAQEILKAIMLVKNQLGVRTVLGVSNISFGLPNRSLVNSVFLAAAFGAGLDLPILDPLNDRYMDTVRTFKVICGQDRSAQEFISFYKDIRVSDGSDKACALGTSDPQCVHGTIDEVEAISEYVLSGRAAPMAAAVSKLLETHEPLEIVNDIFIPLLDLVGQKYDSGEFFLPQLMSSAEAVKAGFDVVRERQESEQPGNSTIGPEKGTVLLATVQGDIHDIGKNIVRMLMENYGLCVIDLGRDVAPETIVEAVQEHKVKLVGLSALMTTTVKSMEQTIALLKQEAPEVSVMVGGAVLTPEYAKAIGADIYAKDAAESARIATKFFENA